MKRTIFHDSFKIYKKEQGGIARHRQILLILKEKLSPLSRTSVRLIPVCFLLLLLLSVTKLKAQANEEFSKGEISAKVAARINPAYDYALYLPTSYTPDKKWAVVYIFDPQARGALAVNRFRAAAEKYNYILIGSNNSRNGLEAVAFKEIMEVVWKDTHERFSIDEKRVYAAGFSGGARVSSLLATLCRSCIAGVIGSGATFPSEIKPTPQQKFIFFGAVGINDYNYPELINFDRKLGELSLGHKLEIFEGVHQWMPPETAEKALAWLNLRAMKKGDLPKDEQFISAMLSLQSEQAKNFLAAGDLLDARRLYLSLVDDFGELRDVSEYLRKVAEINNSAEYKQARKIEEEQLERQFQLAKELLTLALKRVNADKTEEPENIQAIRSLIASLKKKTESPDKNARHVAKRALAQVFASSFEGTIFEHLQQKKFDLAIANLELAAELAPQNGYVRFELARAYALARQKKKTLELLEEAVNLGFQGLKRIETEESFADWRGEARFQKLLETLRKKLVNSTP